MENTIEYLKNLLEEAENPRDELHLAYKEMLKQIILDAICDYIIQVTEEGPDPAEAPEWTFQWVSDYVEKRAVKE